MKRKTWKWMAPVVGAVGMTFATTVNGATIYVTPNGTGTQSGISWQNSKAGVQAGINAASAANNDEVWCSAGTYKPTSGSDRTFSFTLKAGVKVYGGFLG